MTQSVVIIGGGLAGLAAASALAPRGLRITLLESRPRLGGRASSFPDPVSGEWIDNCQHVSMGCCTNLTDFCRRVGIEPLLQTQPVLYFQDERGRVSRMSSAPLPAPLNLAPSFLRAGYLSLGDKLRIAYGMACLMRQSTAAEGTSFRDWLFAHRQTVRTCDRYWGLILTSALNESLENMDFRYARQVFVEGFLRNRASSLVQIPRTALSEFYGAGLERWLAGAGVELRMNEAVTGLEIRDGRVVNCRTRDNAIVEADHFVLAVPFQRVGDLLPPDIVGQDEQFEALTRIGVSPITSVHLWYDRPVMDYPHLVPVGRTVQWLFRRPKDASGNGERSQGAGELVQAVISASRDLAKLGKEQIFERISAEVAEILPRALSARIEHHRVVTERSATYSIVPGIDELRPSQKSSLANLWLAGDYTRTDWPATMEGAVRSGYLAAEGILEKLGASQRLVCPPLKESMLFRLLVRPSAASR